MQNLKEHDADFTRHHFAVVELVNEDKLIAEQVVIDEHADKVTDYMDCLRQLSWIPEKASGPSINTCLLRQLQRRVNRMDTELADVVHKILLLDNGVEELMNERSNVRKILLEVDY